MLTAAGEKALVCQHSGDSYPRLDLVRNKVCDMCHQHNILFIQKCDQQNVQESITAYECSIKYRNGRGQLMIWFHLIRVCIFDDGMYILT